jgi:membrane protein DedA with SNARE-associated domain
LPGGAILLASGILVQWGRLNLGDVIAFGILGAVFLARFVVGLQVFGALVAGMSRMRLEKFALYNLLGGIVWASAVVSLGYFLWARISLVEHWVGRASLAHCTDPRLAVALDVPEAHARIRSRQSARPEDRLS